MRKIDTATAIATRPTAAAPGTEGWWTDGDPGGGIPATIIDQDFLNDLQANLSEIQDAAGVAHTKGPSGDTDLLDAIRALITYATAGTRLARLEYVNATSVRLVPVTGTEIAFVIDGVLVRKTGNLVFDMTADLIPTEGASTAYYLYVYNDAGVLKGKIDNVEPYRAGGTKPGYHGSGGGYAGYLAVGSIWNNSSSDVQPFTMEGGWQVYQERDSDHLHNYGTTSSLVWTTQAINVPKSVTHVRLVNEFKTYECAMCIGRTDANTTLPTGGYHGLDEAFGVDVVMMTGEGTTGGQHTAEQFELSIADQDNPGFKYGLWNASGSVQKNNVIVQAVFDPFNPRL